jgi:AraC-like DNA-binding protein
MAPVIVEDGATDQDGSWRTATREQPGPGLDDVVIRYCGYEERFGAPVRRREVPHGGVVLILSFGEPIDVGFLTGRSELGHHRSFVAGLSDAAAVTRHGGRQHGIQVDLTPLGAHRLLGLPMSELTNQAVPLDALLGRDADRLVDRLASAADWSTRFALLDRVLGAAVADGPEPDREVTRAWQRLVVTDGAVSVGDLADDVGWSRRHLSGRFHRQVGLAPKAAARVLRFQRAVQLLVDPHSDDEVIAMVAARCGYADHSHLIRDFQDLGGLTPSTLRTSVEPGILGLADPV